MKKRIAVSLSGFIFILLNAISLHAATRTVDTIADNGALTACTAAANDCSLRGAVSVSVTGDNIDFAPTLNYQTITLGSEITITQGININGPGTNLLRISGGDFHRHFFLDGGANSTRVIISGLTLQNGGGWGRESSVTSIPGGSIYQRSGFLQLDRVNMQNNRGSVGGAVLALNILVVTNSTLSSNQGLVRGGAVYAQNVLDVSDSTFSGNTAGSFGSFGQGAGIFVNSNNTNSILRNVTVTNNNSLNNGTGGGVFVWGYLGVINSVIAGNTATSNPNVGGDGIRNLNYNFINGDPQLAPLADNGGTTKTHLPLCGSPLMNAGDPNNVQPTDQRGIARPIEGRTEIGAVETYTISVSPATLPNGILGNAYSQTLTPGCGNSPYTFSISSGALPGGLTLQPDGTIAGTLNTTGTFNFTVRTDATGGAFALTNYTVSVFGISPATLPNTFPNISYSQQLTSSGGTAPHFYALDSGTLPAGLTLRSDGLISGTPTQSGNFSFAVRVSDANGISVVKNYGFLVGYYVMNANSSGAGSLRQLINDTPSGGTINFDPVFFNTPRTIALGGSVLNINKSLTIVGSGANLLTIDGENSTRVFSVNNPLTLSGMRIIRGNGSGSVGGCILSNSTLNLIDVRVENCSSPSSGGGIFSNGSLNITSSVISNNTAIGSGGLFQGGGFTANVVSSTISNNTATNGGAGGIGNGGTVSVYLSTLSGNTAVFGGAAAAGPMMIINNSTVSGNLATTNKAGGVYVGVGERLEMTNTTISNNVSNGNLTGGIYSDGGVIQMRNALVAGNRNGDGNAADVAGQILSYGWNMIGTTVGNSFSPSSPTLTGNRVNVPANLAPLGNYGGGFLTHALLPNSQAINNGDPGTSVFNADQRGVNRPIGAQDIGSFELNIAFDQATVPNGTQNIPYSQNLTVTRLAGQLSDKNVSEENLAPFTFALISVAGQNLPNGLTLSSSGLISGTPTTAGSFTFTVMAIDSDGMAGTAQYTIAIVNSPPTITPVNITRLQSSPASNSTIATVSDIQSGASGVNVTISSANPSNGVTVSNIVNTNGTITADVIATCSAVSTSFTLAATDSGGASTTTNLTVNVQASPPNLVYTITPQVPYGGSTMISPTTATDNGSIVSYQIVSFGALTTAPTVNSAGVVSITNARPIGFHTVRVRATDNCATVTDADFIVVVDAVVSKTTDTNDGVCDSDCSLREAVALSDRVYFSLLFNTPQTIVLTSQIGTNRNVTIDGKGKLVTISGNNQTRLFQTSAGGNLTLDSLTLTDGFDSGALGGGALFVNINSAASVISSTVKNNFAANEGGGIYNRGTLTVRNSTITNNSAIQYGGGIFSNGSTTTVNLTNSTITGNLYRTNGGNGAGVNSNNANINVRNTIIAGNLGNAPDFSGTLNSLGYNLIGSTVGTNIVGDTTGNILNTNPRLTPLGNYGGVTQTYALLADSPAINAGDPSYSSTLFGLTDQRGSHRLIGGRIDIGAVESNITFNQNSLPNANTLQVYNQQLSANRQTSLIESEPFIENSYLAPTSFAIVPIAGQSLPPGITLSSGGLLSGMPTLTGNYTFTVQATDTDGISGVKQFTLQVFVPTAAMVSVSGRLVTANGEGIRNAVVNLTDMNGNARTVKTGSFGNYLFENVEAGATYVVSVSSKRYLFERSSQILTVNENAVNVDFTAQE